MNKTAKFIAGIFSAAALCGGAMFAQAQTAAPAQAAAASSASSAAATPAATPGAVVPEIKDVPVDLPWSERMAQSEMIRNAGIWQKDAVAPARWDYVNGLLLLALEKLWHQTGKEMYFDAVKNYGARVIAEDGTIAGYKLDDYNIDNINSGKILFDLFKQTGDNRYRKAMDTLRSQLAGHPRVKAGGFWHKKVYTNQMWLDGLYMGAPFYAQYTAEFGKKEDFDDIALQYILMEKMARDPKTGLLYHAWDESHEMFWADKATGLSKNFWGRAMGWYAMGIVDALDYIPKDHPKRGELIAIVQRLADAVAKAQDPASGVWWQVLDQGGREGNYLEATCSTMFVYAILKGVENGYLDAKHLETAKKGWQGIHKTFITIDADDHEVHLTECCAVAGLGGRDMRDGTYEYYIHERKRIDDGKGTGPFILSALEIESMDKWLPKDASVKAADFAVK